MTIVIFTIIYLLSLLVYYISFGWIDILLSIRTLMIFILSYMAIRILGEDFLKNYEKIIYVLAIISLIIFPFQILFYKEVFNIVNILNYLIPNWSGRNDLYHSFSNIIVFSVNSLAAKRNSGFAWEPKAFGNFLIIALIINMVQNNFKINKKLIVLIIATLTTTSTVTYLILFFLIPIFWLFNKKKSYFLLFLPIFIITILVVSQLPFMKQKIEDEWIDRYKYKELLADTRFANKERSLGRMPSMMLDIQDFLKNPIFGYGVQKAARTQSHYARLVRVNGLADWLATFGIVGFIFLLFSHYFGFKKYLYHNNIKGQTILVIMILFIYFATNLQSNLFWIMLQFLFLINYINSAKLFKIKEKVALEI